MNTLIITGGNINLEHLEDVLNSSTYENIIAVDKGLESLYKLGVLPHHIVGDFDSVNSTMLRFYNDKRVLIHKYNPEKDYTDTDIAVQLAIKLNSKSITIIGATGSRIDHTLANIHILCSCLEKGVSCQILDSNNKIYLINSNTKLEKATAFGKYISLIPFTNTVKGVTLDGFKYQLKNHTLKIGESLGVSNEIIDDIAIIEIKSGILIVIESKD